MVSGLARMRIQSIAVVASCLAGCYSTGDGPDPSTALYFPVGLAVSPGGHALYVANSDFDLQFNAGTVEAYRLGANPTQILYPGLCGSLNLESPPAPYLAMTIQGQPVGPPIANSVRIGAF